MPYPDSIKTLKLAATIKYDVYKRERIKLEAMIKAKIPGSESQAYITTQAEIDWQESHKTFINALSETGF